MKRVVPAVVLLIVAAGLTIYGTLFINQKTSELTDLLNAAHSCCTNRDYHGASDNLEKFCQTFNKNEAILILFVRRDLLAELMRIAEPLFDYANEEMRYDFCIETQRAVTQLEIIRESQFKLI